MWPIARLHAIPAGVLNYRFAVQDAILAKFRDEGTRCSTLDVRTLELTVQGRPYSARLLPTYQSGGLKSLERD